MLRQLFALLFVAVIAPSVLFAQVPLPGAGGSSDGVAVVELPDPLTEEAVREMVARMSDDEVRAFLLDRLDAVAAAQAEAPPPVGTFTKIQAVLSAVFVSTWGAITKLPIVFSAQAGAFSNYAAMLPPGDFGMMFVWTALALAIAFGAEKATNFAVQRWRPNMADDTDSLKGALRYLSKRLVRELFALAVFYAVLVYVGNRLLSPEMLLFMGPAVYYMIWIPRLGAAVSRFVIAPERADLRLVSVDDHWAKYLHRNLIGLFLLVGFTIFLVNFNVVAGVPLGETRIGFWLNAAVHIYVALIIWTARNGLRDMMLGSDPDTTKFDEWVSNHYMHFGLLVTFAMWLTVEVIIGLGDPTLLPLLATAPHFKTMFYLLLAPAIDTAIRGVVRHVLPPMMGEGKIAEDAYKSTKRSFIKIGRVIAGIVVLMLVGNAWHVNLLDLARQTAGESFGGNLIEAAIVAAIGYMIYELVSLYINRRLARERTQAAASMDAEMAAGEGGGAGGSRLATVLPLILVCAQVAIGVVFALLSLSALGLDITPLLAGAGILGLAIGFGAQKLVTDVVGGIFFLIDDAFRTGEYVDVGGTMGTVEKISIRSMQLRHHRGLVHTIPYGEIPKLTNFSRDWVIMKLKFTVPFDTDPQKVKKLFKTLGKEMMEDPLYKDSFIEPFKSQGVFDFDDVGMIIRGKFMAKPGTQFTLRKEIYNRVKKVFAENGIEFARREVRVAIPGLDQAEDLSEEQKNTIAGAAAGVAQQAVEQQSSGDASPKDEQ